MTDALRAHYQDLVETDRRADGARYHAVLGDGTAVEVMALSPSLASRVRDESRFLATLERASRVHHAALLSPLHWGKAGDGTLHVAFRRRDVETGEAQMRPDAVAAAGQHLALALEAIHQAGLWHGAIERSRIVRTSSGFVLRDFGLFAALVAGGVAAGEVTSALCGAPYVSPERQEGAVPDERGDIFSLGASLYELLTGKPPFGGRTTAFVLASVLSDAETEGGASLPSPVVDALLRAIERDPDDRWPTATAFAQALAAGISPRSAHGGATERRGCLGMAGILVVSAGLFTYLTRHL